MEHIYINFLNINKNINYGICILNKNVHTDILKIISQHTFNAMQQHKLFSGILYIFYLNLENGNIHMDCYKKKELEYPEVLFNKHNQYIKLFLQKLLGTIQNKLYCENIDIIYKSVDDIYDFKFNIGIKKNILIELNDIHKIIDLLK